MYNSFSVPHTERWFLSSWWHHILPPEPAGIHKCQQQPSSTHWQQHCWRISRSGRRERDAIFSAIIPTIYSFWEEGLIYIRPVRRASEAAFPWFCLHQRGRSWAVNFKFGISTGGSEHTTRGAGKWGWVFWGRWKGATSWHQQDRGAEISSHCTIVTCTGESSTKVHKHLFSLTPGTSLQQWTSVFWSCIWICPCRPVYV